MKEAKAKLKYLRIAPRKTRLVADLIRGKSASKALLDLSFSKKRAAKPLLKLVNSAVANAKNMFKLDKEELFVKEIRVDEGRTLKRYRARARGRAATIRKRTSHITLVLEEQAKIKSQKSKVKNKK
jgi:large subunit ribosomal protein L22